MKMTETKSRTGEDLSPAEELRTAVSGFLMDFKNFSTGIQADLQKQEDRMNKLDRKTMMAKRPALAAAADQDAPHQKAFGAYLRSGDDDALRGLELEGKALSTAIAADGGYLVDPQLAQRIADKFARSEAAAFISGDGIEKPNGFLNAPAVDDASWTWGSLGYVATGVDGDIGSADAIIDLVYALGAQYRANGTFVMNSKTAGAVRKLKDADGRFLWSDGLAAGEPARLLGYAVLIAEDMPDAGTDTTPIAFGDFGTGYTVAERPDLRVLRDPFSAKPHVLFYATKRVGGAVSDYAAIKLLKFSVS